MKKIAVMIAVLTLVLPIVANGAEKGQKEEFKTLLAEFSYALGMDVGESLKRLDTGIDLDAFMKAIEDSLKDKELLLTREEASKIKKDFFMKIQKEVSEKNIKEGEAFLAENKKKKGVITTDSGLQYMVIKEGDGRKPKETDRVKVHYRGTLIDGTEFDSSHKRGQPATFQVKGVIPGWTEALQLMKEGSKYRIFVPSKLAYGERGAGPQIGPNSTLIFEVELLSIEENASKKAPKKKGK